jgi:cystathionine beta-lyase/cystathionine gamma-synthase
MGPLGTGIKGPVLVVDNTFASPYLQNPLQHGAHIVMHSCTKYIGGHSDLVAGAAMTSDKVLAAKLKYAQNAVGAVPGAMDCFMMLRSLKTLHVRMQRHCENAMVVAKWLEKHPKVSKVIYPGLKSHPQHALAKKQMRGFGGMISVVIKGGLKASRRMLERVEGPVGSRGFHGLDGRDGHRGRISRRREKRQGMRRSRDAVTVRVR